MHINNPFMHVRFWHIGGAHRCRRWRPNIATCRTLHTGNALYIFTYTYYRYRYMCMHEHIYVYIYTYTHIYIYIYIYICIYIYIYMCVCVYISSLPTDIYLCPRYLSLRVATRRRRRQPHSSYRYRPISIDRYISI